MSDASPPNPRRIVKDLPITRLLPNMLTLMSLCSGLTGIRFALHEKWEQAVLAIVPRNLSWETLRAGQDGAVVPTTERGCS